VKTGRTSFNDRTSFATVIQLKNGLSRKRSGSSEGRRNGSRPSFSRGYLGLIRNAVIEFNVRIEYFRLQRGEGGRERDRERERRGKIRI